VLGSEQGTRTDILVTMKDNEPRVPVNQPENSSNKFADRPDRSRNSSLLEFFATWGPIEIPVRDCTDFGRDVAFEAPAEIYEDKECADGSRRGCRASTCTP
jgi:hypothetical protein